MIYKPGSVCIHPNGKTHRGTLDDHSSGMFVTNTPLATNPSNHAQTHAIKFLRFNHLLLFGLAPDGVYPAIVVTNNAVRSYRPISPLPEVNNFFLAV